MDVGKSTRNRPVLQVIFVLNTKSGANTSLWDQLHHSQNMETVTTTVSNAACSRGTSSQ